MNRQCTHLTGVVFLLCIMMPVPGLAQGSGLPLAIQGLDQPAPSGSRATAMGGTLVASGADASSLFGNPAELTALPSAEIRIGGVWSGMSGRQEQDWLPNRFYPNLSLLTENMLDGIRAPVVTEPQDGLQRAYDALQPDWNRSTVRLRPLNAALAIPTAVAGVPVVFGAGFQQAVVLDHYYRNNNNLDPNLGLYRPQPIPVVTGLDSLRVRWYASERERKGVIHGYSGAVAVALTPSLSVAVSGTYYRGTSDDRAYEIERGAMTFFYDAFRLDSVGGSALSAGSSTYSGVAVSLGAHYKSRTFALGGRVRLPYTLTHEWNRTVSREGVNPGSSTLAGSDRLTYPLQMMFGLALMPADGVTLAVDVHMRGTNDVGYAADGAGEAKPWRGGTTVHCGAEYRASAWLTVRGGYRTVVESFVPAGAGLFDEPARGSAFSAGAGLRLGNVGVDVAYEFLDVRYLDKWETNVNTNVVQRHLILLETSLRF